MVTVESAEEAQKNLEAKMQHRWEAVQSGTMSRQEAFGKIEEWILKFGQHQLWLIPFNGEWLYYDRLHDTWESTGYYAGQVTFVAAEKILGVKYRSGAGCSHCGEPLAPQAAFCTKCGASAKPETPPEPASAAVTASP